MATKVKTLDQLFIDELKDIFSAETQIIEALPKVSEAVQNTELKAALKSHLTETKEQAQRLKSILKALGETTEGPECEAMKGILKEGAGLIEDVEKGPVRDAALIGGCQKVEHYEMCAYGTARTFATLLGHADHAKTLQTTLEEEENADSTLNDIAEGIVNDQAAKKGEKVPAGK